LQHCQGHHLVVGQANLEEKEEDEEDEEDERTRRGTTCSTSSNLTSPFIFLSNAGKIARSSFRAGKPLVALANSMKLIDVLLAS